MVEWLRSPSVVYTALQGVISRRGELLPQEGWVAWRCRLRRVLPPERRPIGGFAPGRKASVREVVFL